MTAPALPQSRVSEYIIDKGERSGRNEDAVLRGECVCLHEDCLQQLNSRRPIAETFYGEKSFRVPFVRVKWIIRDRGADISVAESARIITFLRKTNR